MGFADQLTVARIVAVPVAVLLYAWNFENHYFWATLVFALAMATDWADGRWARRTGNTSDFGRLVDPVADKLLIMAALILLIEPVFPAWMVALIVAREFLVTGLRLAALQEGIVISARDLGKWKTGTQAAAVVLGGLAAGGAILDDAAWWALLIALALTWISGIGYARIAPRALRRRQAA